MFLELLYFFGVNVTLVVPGYILIKKFGLFEKNLGLQLCLAYVSTIFFYAFLATFTYVLKIDPWFSQSISWLAIVASIVLFLRDGLYKKFITNYRFPLGCLLATSLFSLLFISLPFNAPPTIIPDPQSLPERNYSTLNIKVLNVAQTQANDNYVPYRQAQFFINRSDPSKDSFINEWGVDFFVRTPLMGAVTANYFNLLGDKPPIDYIWSAKASDTGHTYKKFQILAQVLNSLLVIPGFYLIRRLFSKRAAYISLLFIVPNIYFVYNSFFSWPKSLVAFFILTSWILLIEKRSNYTLLAGVISGIAYLTHDLAVLYIGASFIYLLVGKRFKEILYFTPPLILFMLPWLITASVIYNKASNFIYYPFSTKGIPQAADKVHIFQQFIHTSPFYLLSIKIENLFYLLSPYQLLSSEGGQVLPRRLWGLSLFSIPGALGLGLIAFAIIGILKKMLPLAGAIFVFVPVLLSVFIIGWPKGLGALHFAEALVVLLIGLSIYFLDSLKNKAWLAAAFLVNTVQLLYFTLYSYKFTYESWFSDTRGLIVMPLMATIVTVCGWFIYLIGNSHRDSLINRL